MIKTFFTLLMYIAFAGCDVTQSTTSMIVGDSILASNTPIQKDLETWSGHPLRNYAKIGAGVQKGWVISIPEQYETYRGTIVPTTVLMDGGGNDVNGVRYDCGAYNDRCRSTIDNVLQLLHNLFQRMKADGVKHIIYLGFYYVGGLNKAVDYGVEGVRKICQPSSGCYVVDLRNLTVQVGWDGMHPVTTSYHDIAQEIWKTKQHYDIPL